MGLLKNISEKIGRRRRNAEEILQEPEKEAEGIKRDDVNMRDTNQRERYVTACLEQMAEASKELETLGSEYDLVTSYLTDMEEIEALPPEIQEQLSGYAKQIIELENSEEQNKKKRHVMKEEDYNHMERISEYMPEGYDKLKEAEAYQTLIKNDLGRLDGEKHAYYFRKNELKTGQSNMKGMTLICVGAMAFLVILLSVLGSAFKMDVQIGYVIAVLIAAVALTMLYVKYEDSKREMAKLERTINKLVLLQNTVKIRYVNNTNLLEYLYMKYGVDHSSKLKKLWEEYQLERAQREEEAQLRKNMEFSQAALVNLLRRCKIKDPDIWIHQTAALCDNREMVEIRHGLIIRRQKLRKQMEYNAKMAQDAQDEVKDLVQKYPEYAKGILDMVSDYEKALA